MTNNDQQHTTQTTKEWATRTHKDGVNPETNLWIKTIDNTLTGKYKHPHISIIILLCACSK